MGDFGEFGGVMDWQKYTIKEWLVQYGAWCNMDCNQNTGNIPKITLPHFWAVGVKTKRTNRVCQISDFEAYHISQMLQQARQILPDEIEVLCMSAMVGLSVRQIANIKGVNYTFIKNQIIHAQYYLLGFNCHLRLE
ncbi:antiterminator Q family protein [Moraxella bovoculi]|uniref:antiterminator Q family protein n=1 Tax=Moraxella bovoculi TaxID=386891 RepID=UPI0012D40A24|nr:antiterminator Q family protein [Moraxella bovoculi]